MLKYCSECGTEVGETDKFCKSCGQSLVVKSEKLPSKIKVLGMGLGLVMIGLMMFILAVYVAAGLHQVESSFWLLGLGFVGICSGMLLIGYLDSYLKG